MPITLRKRPFLNPRNYCYIILSFLIILLLFSSQAVSGNGECGLDFLNITVGAFSASTGQANYAGVEGAEAVFLNPSLLGDDLGGFASYQYLIMDTKSQAVSLSAPLNSVYSIGFGINIFDPGGIEGFDDLGNRIGDVNAGDYLVRLALSSRRNINYGFSMSYYEQRLDDIIGRGYGFGMGISGDLGVNRIGLSLDNIGPAFKMGESSDPLPTKIALSGWFPFQNRFINLSADMIYSLETGFRVAGGFEYSPFEGLFFRAGGNNDTPFSLGFGISNGALDIDYCYIPSDLFGERHLFSFSITH